MNTKKEKNIKNTNKGSGILFRDLIHNEKRGLQKAIDQVIYGSTYKRNEIKSLLQGLSG